MSQVLVGTVSGDGATYEVWAQENGAGGTDFTIKLTAGTGDLLGFFLNYADSNNSLGTNTNVTASYFGQGGDTPADDINQVGSSANTMQGTGVMFDAGMQFGQPGQNDIDDSAGVSFTINGLTFADINEMTFGIRSQATPGLDTPDIPEDGSVKLIGTFQIPTPPSDSSFDGLSQGFWAQHPDNWDGYSTGQYYDSVFGVNAFGSAVNDKTLLQAIKATGGGEAALARQAVGAILNDSSTNDGLTHDYRFDFAQIKDAVQFVYGIGDGISGNDGIFNATLGEHLQRVLEFWNNAHHDETTADPTPLNLADDDVASIILGGGAAKPNVNTDANSDPGLTGSGVMYTGTLIEVLQTLYPHDGWTAV